MANDVEIRVKTTGASDAAGELDSVSTSIRRVGRSSSDEAGKLDKLGEAGGRTETRFLGLGAGISGVSTLMSEDAGPEDYAMAVADLGDSVEHTVIPALKNLSRATLTNIADTVKAGVTHAATAVKVVAGWVLMGIQATINAAKMAAAWLISLGPIGLVIAAIAAVIAILIALGVGFDDIKRIAENVFNWIKENWPLLLAILTGPFGLAVLAINKNWDKIKGGATAVKNWIRDRVTDIVSFFTGIPGRIASSASSIGSTIINGIKSGVTGAIGFASDIASSIKSAINSALHLPFTIHGPGPLPDFTIPAFARGGLATGLAIVGERGRELVNFGAAGGRVRSNPDTEQMMAGLQGGGLTVNVYVAGSVMSEKQLIQVVRDEAFRGGFRGAFG